MKIKKDLSLFLKRNFHTSVPLRSVERSSRQNFRNYILQSCSSPRVPLPEHKEQISVLKNTCFWIMHVGDTEKKNIPENPVLKGSKIPEPDFISTLIGFQSSALSNKHEKDWMKFLKDDSGVLFDRNRKPKPPKPRYEMKSKTNPFYMPLKNKLNVVIMDPIDDGSVSSVYLILLYFLLMILVKIDFTQTSGYDSIG